MLRTPMPDWRSKVEPWATPVWGVGTALRAPPPPWPSSSPRPSALAIMQTWLHVILKQCGEQPAQPGLVTHAQQLWEGG